MQSKVWLDLSSDAGPHRYSRNPELTFQAQRTLRRSARALRPGIDVKHSLERQDLRKTAQEAFTRK